MIKRIVIIAIILSGAAAVFSYYRFEMDRIDSINAAISRSEELLREKRNTVRNYKEQVEFYSTPEGIEHLAREQYNLKTSADRVILLQSQDLKNDD